MEKYFGDSRIEFEVGEEVHSDKLESVSISTNNSEDELDAIGYATHTGSFDTETVNVSIGYNYNESKIQGLQRISGVGEQKAKLLYEAGYETFKDVQKASQSELSEIDGIGNALAARIKADVGDYELRDKFDIDAEEIIHELNGEKEETSFLEEETLMVNIHE